MWLCCALDQTSLSNESRLLQSCQADHPAALLPSEHDSSRTPTRSPRLHPAVDPPQAASTATLRDHCRK